MTDTPSDIIKGWKDRATPDYFSMFQSLWVAFNAWYKDWGLSSHSLGPNGRDRDFIDKLKLGGSHNRMFTNFSQLISDQHKGANFRFHLEELDTSLKSIGFENDIDKEFRKIAKANIHNFRMIKSIFDRKEFQSPTPNRLLGPDYEEYLFQATIENLYTIRNKFFHGEKSTNEQNLRVVKNAYQVLYSLIENI